MIIVGADISINSTGLVKLNLDDKDLSIKSVDWVGFTDVIKTQKIYQDNLKLVPKEFDNYIERTIWMNRWIKEYCRFASYVAIEDYSFGSKGKSFHIGGFTEFIKLNWYTTGINIRTYDIVEIKKFAVGNCNAKKHEMVKRCLEINPFDLSKLDDGTEKSREKSPLTDIVDAYWITNMLHTELLLRRGEILLKDLDENGIWAFNRTTKTNKENILCRPFLCKHEC
jgi:Holliday junction resolvasome RuvABC endonuclease subunit